MRLRLAAITLLLLACSAARAQEERRVEVEVGHVAVSFALPAGFERMSDEEVAAQYARGVPPKAVFRDPRGELRVTVNGFDADAQGVRGLPSLSKRLKSDFDGAFPDAEWVSRGVVKMGGVRWNRLRLKATAGVGRVVNDTYATIWLNKVVLVNFYCPVAEYGAHRAAFEESARSIQLSVLVNAPADSGSPAVRKP